MAPAPPPRRLETVIAAWLFTQPSAHTRAAYANDLAQFLWWADSTGRVALEVQPADIEHYLRYCGYHGVAGTTVNRRLAALTSFFHHAVAAGVARANPIVQADRVDVDSASGTAELAMEECERLWDAAEAQGPKTAGLVGLLLFDGLKLNEALPLDLTHLHLFATPPSVEVARRGRVVEIAIDARTARALRTYARGRDGGPVFVGDSPTREPARLTRFGADYLIKRAGQRAGFHEPLTANALRRAHATNAFAAGDSVEEIRHAMGHADVRTTRRYLRGGPPERRPAR